MSTLTLCNYCSLRNIKKHAKEDGMKVIVLPCHADAMGGSNVFTVPKGTSRLKVRKWKDYNKVPPNGDKNFRKYFSAWMKTIPERCYC
ncbi:hypothetical protein LCGC14_1919600 [marine sediment metagenome]|uniref:Uncharacterized protein n=1 Tax=marine sediment metagenome TaxID=412755 RepID=A0A0F9FR06_9ZZZZ